MENVQSSAAGKARPSATPPAADDSAVRVGLRIDVALLALQPRAQSLPGNRYQFGVLVVPADGGWRLPSAHLRAHEPVAVAAARAADDAFGLLNLPLTQLSATEGDADDVSRVFSIGHFCGISAADADAVLASGTTRLALVSESGATVVVDGVDVRLPAGQAELVAAAVSSARTRYTHEPDPLVLLPDLFTLADLKEAHDAVCGGSKFSTDAFRRVMEPQLLIVGERKSGSVGRPAKVYRRTGPVPSRPVSAPVVARNQSATSAETVVEAGTPAADTSAAGEHSIAKDPTLAVAPVEVPNESDTATPEPPTPAPSNAAPRAPEPTTPAGVAARVHEPFKAPFKAKTHESPGEVQLRNVGQRRWLDELLAFASASMTISEDPNHPGRIRFGVAAERTNERAIEQVLALVDKCQELFPHSLVDIYARRGVQRQRRIDLRTTKLYLPYAQALQQRLDELHDLAVVAQALIDVACASPDQLLRFNVNQILRDVNSLELMLNHTAATGVVIHDVPDEAGTIPTAAEMEIRSRVPVVLNMAGAEAMAFRTISDRLGALADSCGSHVTRVAERMWFVTPVVA